MKKLLIVTACSLLVATGGLVAFNFDREPGVVLPEIMQLKTIPEQLRASSLYGIFNSNNAKQAREGVEVKLKLGNVEKNVSNMNLSKELMTLITDPELKKNTSTWLEKFRKAADTWYKVNLTEDLSIFLTINFDIEPNIFFGNIYDFIQADPISHYTYLRLYTIYNSYQNPGRNTAIFDIDGEDQTITGLLEEEKEELVKTSKPLLSDYIDASGNIDEIEAKLKGSKPVTAKVLNDILVDWADYVLGLRTLPALKELVPQINATELEKDLKELTESLAALVPKN
jgi:hypothetical protein